MPTYPYTLVTGKLKTLLGKVRSSGIPPKLSAAHLKTLGFTSSNDAGMIGVLKFIGLTDGAGIPTPLWSEYRGQNHREVLGKAIRQGYADLFAIYPDANARTVTDLAHVFSTSSTAGEKVVNQTVQTFKALVEEADFSRQSGFDATVGALTTGPLHAAPAAASPAAAHGSPSAKHPAVHIDIQIHISPESSAEQIDKMFESMAKHLYGANNPAG
ncbi:DUF5343 domain-containing protein [Bradyrhizobium sp. Arg816]|uniref:DUF5343 domain-containing protein n=1 Tax=Bradyrhizobium sp. Arg816 TaxID=2998491 RepID=UPI00249F5F19|nr:DUF5343 domain-containing protein [Bradyrhizobium sp. Arg816]MDI3563660.1 DUF5343 domain-containing protein [Bradyrhizobium sp. Arg816]